MGAIHVEMARTIDRDRLVESLAARGFETRVLDDDGRVALEVPCHDGPSACHELFVELESWIVDLGLPLVPLELEGSIVLRPPVG